MSTVPTATAVVELEEWRNTGNGTVYLNRLSADGTKVAEPIVGQKTFLVSPADRNSHTRSCTSHSADPFQNGTFYPESDNAKAASAELASRRPKPAPAPAPELSPIDQLRAENDALRRQMDRIEHKLSGSTEPFPEPEPEAPREPDAFEGKDNPNVLDEGEMIEILTSADDAYVGRWLASIDSASILGNLLGRARAGAGSLNRQRQINDRLHQVDPNAPGLPGTTSAAGGPGDSAPAPGTVDLERLHVADEFDPNVGAPGIPRRAQTGVVDSIAGDVAMASEPGSNVPPPQALPPHLAGLLPQN